MANAYDALIVIAFGAAARGFTGPEIAEGMGRISDPNGQSIEGSQSNIQIGFQTLANGDTIDYLGASGPLNFNVAGDPANTPISLWCFEDGGTPDKGAILTLMGEFSRVRCNAEPPDNPNNSLPDMGDDMSNADM